MEHGGEGRLSAERLQRLQEGWWRKDGRMAGEEREFLGGGELSRKFLYTLGILPI